MLLFPSRHMGPHLHFRPIDVATRTCSVLVYMLIPFNDSLIHSFVPLFICCQQSFPPVSPGFSQNTPGRTAHIYVYMQTTFCQFFSSLRCPPVRISVPPLARLYPVYFAPHLLAFAFCLANATMTCRGHTVCTLCTVCTAYELVLPHLVWSPIRIDTLGSH